MIHSPIEFHLGDQRLSSRAQLIFSRICDGAWESFPKIFNRYSELEGFYRFVTNPRVDPNDLFSGVLGNSLKQVPKDSDVLIVHDTTEICPKSKKQESSFHPLRSSNASPGFFAHVSLAIELNECPKILGPIDLKVWTRAEKNEKKRRKKVTESRESERWATQALNSASSLLNPERAIHVMDRESDAYELLFQLVENKSRFVTRLSHNRCLLDEVQRKRGGEKIFDTLRKISPQAVRMVTLSRREAQGFGNTDKIHPPRNQRTAALHISAVPMILKGNERYGLKGVYPKGLVVNCVRVYEPYPPQNEKGVEWFLCTSEPIDTPEQLERIVEIYKKRWIIEDFFKALKSGCSLEKRLLESADSWTKVLIFFLPVACNLYNLKTLKGETLLSDIPDVITPAQVEILNWLKKGKKKTLLTLTDAMAEIAKLGGHIPYAGSPGWIVLGRGYLDLLKYEEGWKAAELSQIAQVDAHTHLDS